MTFQPTRKVLDYGGFRLKAYFTEDSTACSDISLRQLVEANPEIRQGQVGLVVQKGQYRRIKVIIPVTDEARLTFIEHAFFGERKISPNEGYPLLGALETVVGRELTLAGRMNKSGDFPETYLRVWVPERALIVEDVPEWRTHMREDLTVYGFSRIDCARDKAEALEVVADLKDEHFDLAILDCGLAPEIGFSSSNRSVDLAMELIQRGEDAKRIIVCSGDPSMGPKAAEIGAKFVSKSRYVNDLHPAIISALSA